MSTSLMTYVWEHLDLDHPQQSVALALADWANDDGTSIFPSVERIAWKTGYSERQVRRILRQMQEVGLLVLVAEARDHRPREYQLVVGTPTVARKAPFQPRQSESSGRTKRPGGQFDRADIAMSAAGGHFGSDRADIAMSPEPSLDPSVEPSTLSSSATDDVDLIWAAYTERFGSRYVLTPARRKLIVAGLAVRSAGECVEAIEGLHRSGYHRDHGYVDLKYALRGGGRDPAPDATIDRMSAIGRGEAAATSNGNGRVPTERERLDAKRAKALEPLMEAMRNGVV